MPAPSDFTSRAVAPSPLLVAADRKSLILRYSDQFGLRLKVQQRQLGALPWFELPACCWEWAPPPVMAAGQS